MATIKKTCATCAQWQCGAERHAAYLASCPVAGRRTQFDEGCAEHRPLPIGPPGGWPASPGLCCGGALPEHVQPCEVEAHEIIITFVGLPDLQAAGEAMSKALRTFSDALAHAGGPLRRVTHERRPEQKGP